MDLEVSAIQISMNLIKNWTQIKYNFIKQRKTLNSKRNKKNLTQFKNIEN